MSSIYAPDLSGISWEYYFSTYQRTIFKYNQKVMFDVPVFQNERLEVIRLGVLPVTLVYGVDYIVYDDDIDYDAMSVCKNIDPNFNIPLLKSISIIINDAHSFKVQMKFNQLFADSINYTAINQNREIEVTPMLIANMVEQIAYLQQLIIDTAGSYSPQSVTVKLALLEDPNGASPDNLVIDEPHDIDTLNNRCLIRTVYGAFFKDSVIIKNGLTGVALVPDIDYMVLDLDMIRTKITSNESGVYQTIKVLKAMVGEVKVSYQAYGGVADVSSMRTIQDRIGIIEDYLSRTSYLTPKTLPADPSICGIRDKIQEMEGTMRLLLQNGLPNYGDVSSGHAVVKRITSQDTAAHWWSIATLYRVAGSADNVLADVFKFRFKSLISNLIFECDVVVNVNANSSNRLTVTCNNSNIPADTLAKYCPKLRIIDVSAGGVYSGIVLQLGMKLGTGILQETFDIEDMSGRESCWQLIPFSATATPPEDTAVLMPNGVSVFSYNDSVAHINEAVIPFKEGLNIITASTSIPLQLGNININTVGITENFDIVVQNVGTIDINNAKSFVITAIAEIGGANERKLEFIVPINSKDSLRKIWSGNTKVSTSEEVYQIEVKLWYSSTDSAYKIGYYVSTVNTQLTLNVVATKLVF